MTKQILLLVFASLSVAATAQSTTTPADTFFAPVKYRNIGPFRGGRSVCATGIPNDPVTYYMGTTGGGLWKTSDAGQHWHNVSDGYFKTGSVGAVTVAESNPNTVYVGMGEHAPRGVMTSYGDGVYKSTDAGKTWTHRGLAATEHISRIRVHPDNPDLLYVAAQGALHAPNGGRGVYRSEDGGEHWERILYVNDTTGCAELAMDAHNPQVLYASMWHHQRLPWQVVSGGRGSGIYKSTDGGDNWTKLTGGLPAMMGKSAISVSAANPDRVYALVEADWEEEKGGLYVSNDAGKSFKQVSKDHRLVQRAWYYTEVFADPNQQEVVYVLSAPALRSIDGGKSWERLSGTHGDYHDLWINPANSRNMVIANDGGAAISYDYGGSWSRQDNMPTAQFYRISVDNRWPYRIYAGQQDNTSVVIKSRNPSGGSITASDWEASAGGESAFLAFDPDEPKKVMGGSYLGTIELLRPEAGTGTGVMAAPIQYLGEAARDMKYLFNWNAPIVHSRHEPGTWYHAAQLVLRSRDDGMSWEEASPDLTRDLDEKQGLGGGPITNEAVGAENYGTIGYLIESPHEKGVFYTGSDDGLVHVTRDNMSSWQNVTPKGLRETLVNAIDVSPHDPATAYVATTRYKFGDKRPSLWKTTNYGKSWTNITGNLPENTPTRVVREDAERKGLLFAGTETGLYVSWNDGGSWEPLQLNLPVTPILDLKVHRGDLVVATSGRSFWLLDDLALLRNYEPGQRADKLYEPEVIVLTTGRSPLNGPTEGFTGTDPLEGVNPASGAVLYYHLTTQDEPVTLEIKDANGKVVNTFSSEKDEDFNAYAGGPSAEPALSNHEGLNRFVWDLGHRSLPGVPTAYIEGSFAGHTAIPGKYTAELTVDEVNHSAPVTILPNPTYPAEIDYAKYDRWMSEAEQNLSAMHELTNELYQKQQTLREVIKKDLTSREHRGLCEKANALLDRLEMWDEKMVQRQSKAYDDVENFPNKFTANYLYLINASNSPIPAVNRGSEDRRRALDAEWATLEREGSALRAELEKMNKDLWAAGIGAL